MTTLTMAPPEPGTVPTPDDLVWHLLGASRWVINTSGGKDSQTSMRQALLVADRIGYERRKIIAVHADLGRIEWAGSRELAEEQASYHKLPFYAVKYRDKAGRELSLLQAILRRGKWPSSKQRYCTSDHKRDPIKRIFTMLGRQVGYCSIINIMGMRADESRERAKLVTFQRNEKSSNSKRVVYNWLPIHGWTAAQVWADIRASGVRYHRAYDLGMPRLSCKFCIFSPPAALIIAGREDPELLREYVRAEESMGHTFRDGFSLKTVLEAVERGEDAGAVDDWEM